MDLAQNAAADWPPHRGETYQLALQHDKLAPLLRKGSNIVFDPSVAPRIGDVVALWHHRVPDAEPVIGVLARLTEENGIVRLDADGNDVTAFKRSIVTIDVAPTPNAALK
jgi:hypothetical protein